MSDDKKLSVSNRGKLGVGSGSGQVRQNFSHGRSKPVVVERKRRRILKKGETPASSRDAVKETPSADRFKPHKAREEVGDLSNEELSHRAEALQSAIRQAEEDRRRAAEEKRKREEEDAKRRAEEEARSEEERTKKQEEEARRKAEEDAKRRAEEESRKKAKEAEEAQRLAEASVPVEEKPKERSPNRARKVDEERDEKEEVRKKHRPVRRTEERRRSGKLTVTMALEDGGEETRQRSLAAMKRAQAKKLRAERGEEKPKKKKVREVIIPESITVQELSNRMAERAPEVIKVLMQMDVMATINDNLDQDTAELVVAEFGHTVKRVAESDVEIGLVGDKDADKDLKSRPPVVTVMGHVDHGKTSLLDALRKTDVVAGEAGGITQHIGAYQVQLKGDQKITFIDTPGHEAFTDMRSRGASVTDIVILVVAADDGIMPQTVEAINHAKAADVPIIVAINKIDKEGANPDRVRQELLQHEVIVEEMSGDVLDIEVSALKGTGLDKLEEAILLQAELMELKANPDRDAEGIIIEAKLEKGRGPVATVLIRRGTLRKGDIFVAGAEWGRVRALMDDRGRHLNEAGPSQPVEVLGLQGAPSAGDDFAVVENEARAREVAEYRQSQALKKRVGTGPASLESMFSALKEAQAKEFPVVIKGDVQGSVEAIAQALEKVGNDEIKARIIHGAVGGISETDVSLAKASNALILGFNVRANKQAREAAEQEGVPIQYYSVIYDLVDGIKALMAGELEPEIEETVIGTAEVKDTFKAGKAGKAAGCMVVDGVVKKSAKARLLRDDTVVYTGGIVALRRFKDDVSEVKSGTECGILLENFNDVKTGDVIEVFEETEHKRTL